MMTEKDYSDYYKKISNTELLEILENPKQYQQLAIQVAKEEFANRNLSEEQINQARLPLIEKQLLKERQQQKLQSIESNIMETGSSLIDTLRPIQNENASINKTILLIILCLSFVFIFQIADRHMLFAGTIKEFFLFPIMSFEILFPIIILPIALILFGYKKKNRVDIISHLPELFGYRGYPGVVQSI